MKTYDIKQKTLTFEPEDEHYRVKELNLLCSLPDLKKVVTIDNYSTGTGHSCHPNIDKSGSVDGMKNLGYWDKNDKTLKQGDYIYNLSHVVCSSPLDELCNAIEQNKFVVNRSVTGTVIYTF